MTAEASNESSVKDCQYGSEFGFGEETFWLTGVLLVIIGTVGLLGNIFTIAVLCRSKMRKSVFYNLLLALACFDTLFILTYGGGSGYLSLACPPNYSVRHLLDPIYHIFLTGSVYMTVAISMERYLGICHPHLRFSRRSLVFILPVIFISLAYTFPMFLELEKGSFVNGIWNYRDPGYINTYAYDLWASVIILTILPFVALLYLNGSIIAAVRRSNNLQKTKDRSEGHTTKILFCIVIIFIILHLPRVIFLFQFFYDLVYTNSSWFWSKSLVNLSLIMNSSVNFVIYSLVGSKFREEFVQVFKCKKAPASDTITSGGGEEFSVEECT